MVGCQTGAAHGRQWSGIQVAKLIHRARVPRAHDDGVRIDGHLLQGCKSSVVRVAVSVLPTYEARDKPERALPRSLASHRSSGGGMKAETKADVTFAK